MLCFVLFLDVTAIIFVVACSSYNLVLREDPSQVSMYFLSEGLICMFLCHKQQQEAERSLLYLVVSAKMGMPKKH